MLPIKKTELGTKTLVRKLSLGDEVYLVRFSSGEEVEILQDSTFYFERFFNELIVDYVIDVKHDFSDQKSGIATVNFRNNGQHYVAYEDCGDEGCVFVVKK